MEAARRRRALLEQAAANTASDRDIEYELRVNKAVARVPADYTVIDVSAAMARHRAAAAAAAKAEDCVPPDAACWCDTAPTPTAAKPPATPPTPTCTPEADD